MTPHLVLPHAPDETVDRERPAAAVLPTRATRSLARYLPQVATATAVVALVPVVTVWLLRSAGVFRSPWIGLVLAMALSSLLSSAGCAYWKRRKASSDLLFSELLLWGWLQRCRAERQLANSVHLLGLHPGGPGQPEPPVGDRERLFRQVAGAIEAQDPYTRGHSARVARYSASIARKMGLAKPEVEKIRAAALVHDVGKLRVRPEILNKPSRLTEAEFAVIRRHPVDGAEMLSGLKDDELTAIVRHHHERLDGKGYPDGLAGEEIPLGARIIAVADTFDAITSVRPYRPRSAHKKAFDILVSEQGSQLDRDAVHAFLSCYSGSRSIALWSMFTTVLQRVSSMLTGQASAATVTAGNVMTVAITTVAIGGVAIAPPILAGAHPLQTAGHGRSVAASPGHATLVGTRSPATGNGSRPAAGGAARGTRAPAGHGPSAAVAYRAPGLASSASLGTAGSASNRPGHRTQHRSSVATHSAGRTPSAPVSRPAPAGHSAPGAGTTGSQGTGSTLGVPSDSAGTGQSSGGGTPAGGVGQGGGAQGNRGVGHGDGGGAQGNRGVGHGDGGGAQGNRGVGHGDGGQGSPTSNSSSGDTGSSAGGASTTATKSHRGGVNDGAGHGHSH